MPLCACEHGATFARSAQWLFGLSAQNGRAVGMSFLNPIMLAGLVAISVPIIIHLLNRRKFQKVVWAAMRFLRLSVEQNQRRMKIEDLILLVLRCLLLVLLALALPRPALLSNTADRVGQS